MKMNAQSANAMEGRDPQARSRLSSSLKSASSEALVPTYFPSSFTGVLLLANLASEFISPPGHTGMMDTTLCFVVAGGLTLRAGRWEGLPSASRSPTFASSHPQSKALRPCVDPQPLVFAWKSAARLLPVRKNPGRNHKTHPKPNRFPTGMAGGAAQARKTLLFIHHSSTKRKGVAAQSLLLILPLRLRPLRQKRNLQEIRAKPCHSPARIPGPITKPYDRETAPFLHRFYTEIRGMGK